MKARRQSLASRLPESNLDSYSVNEDQYAATIESADRTCYIAQILLTPGRGELGDPVILSTCRWRHRGHLSDAEINEDACNDDYCETPKDPSGSTICQAEQEIAAKRNQTAKILSTLPCKMDIHTRKVVPKWQLEQRQNPSWTRAGSCAERFCKLTSYQTVSD